MKAIKKIIALLILSILSIAVFACDKATTAAPTTAAPTTVAPTTSATPTEAEYKIEWVVEGVVVETDYVKEGAVPTFDGTQPTKVATTMYTFTFKGWDKEIVAATENTIYTAEFNQRGKGLPADFSLSNLKVPYDGEEHSIVAENVPEGAEIVYTNNGRTEPGSQTVKVAVTYAGNTYNYSLNLNITKCESTLTAVAAQTVSSGELPAVELNNEEQTISSTPIYMPGVYYMDCYAAESAHYYESNHIEVKLTVEEAKPFGISFLSTTKLANGSEQALTATDIPEGYTVEYSNNTLTNVGKTYAVCDVYDSTDTKVASIHAIFELDNPENTEFTEFIDQLLVDYLGEDYFAWNIYSVNPTALGLDRTELGEAEWYSYLKYDAEYAAAALEDFIVLDIELDAFAEAALSNNQILAYAEAKKLVDFYLGYWAVDGGWQNQLENLAYVDQFGGYCSDFSTSIEGYTYRTEQDVIDVLSYVKSTASCYPTYITYVEDRIEAGYALSDYTLSEMIDYLGDIIDQGEDYYLAGLIKEKINATPETIVSAEKKVTYCAQVDEYFETYFMPANAALKTGLEACKGHITSISGEGYWAKYENGDELFIAEIKDLVGDPNLDVEAYIAELDEHIEEYSEIINDIIAAYRNMSGTQSSNWYAYISGGTPFVDLSDPYDMIDYLKVFAKTMVPDLESDPEVLVKYMDQASAEKSNAVAYYMRSAIDAVTDEYITLNPTKTGKDLTDTLSTMGHEGYPGHLYAHAFVKDTEYCNFLKISSSTAFAEGWATYVQLKLYDYIKANLTGTSTAKNTAGLAVDYLYYNQLLGYLLYTRVDAMIHIEGKTIEEIADYMDGLGFNGGAAAELYQILIEMPAGYAAYGYGQIFMNDLHIYCAQQLGSLYNEVDYNAFILGTPQNSLFELKELTEEYISDVKFMYGVAE